MNSHILSRGAGVMPTLSEECGMAVGGQGRVVTQASHSVLRDLGTSDTPR